MLSDCVPHTLIFCAVAICSAAPAAGVAAMAKVGGVGGAAGTADHAVNDVGDMVKLAIPLVDGELRLGDALRGAAEGFGVAARLDVDRLNVTVDASRVLDQVRLGALERITGGVLQASLAGDELILRLDRSAIDERLRRSTVALRKRLGDAGDGERQPYFFGLTFATWGQPRLPADQLLNMPERAVVLVHGMDDPGFMWDSLIPELLARDYAVARFEYPNDGPISEAADMLAMELQALQSRGCERIDIVAHSMGGLVARDVLARPAYYNCCGAMTDRLPAIDRLIMLGTPNYGSHLARLHPLSELREHVARGDAAAAIGERTNDGHGEAAEDLLPGSTFLRRLNARALPTHTRITIVAARWSRFDGEDVRSMAQRLDRFAQGNAAPDWLRETMDAAAARIATDLTAKAVDAVGDGCVTLESARLDGVEDVVIVRANHLGMIYGRYASGMPPAIPIILDRLR